MAAGVPTVLSPIAAEGIGLRNGIDAIIAEKPEEWVAGITLLYKDEKAWVAMSRNVQEIAERHFSFRGGVAALKEALASIDFHLSDERPALHANSARPAYPNLARHEGEQESAAAGSSKIAPRGKPS
jgi:O-antigen biosynthesis protein